MMSYATAVAIVFVTTALVASAILTTTGLLVDICRAAHNNSMSGTRTLPSGVRTDEQITPNRSTWTKSARTRRRDVLPTLGGSPQSHPVARARLPCGGLESRTGLTTAARELVTTVASQMKAGY